MKKIFIFPILLILLLPFLMGQQIINLDTDHLGITWDAVTPIAGSVITYEVVLAPEGNRESFFVVEEIGAIEYDVYFPSEGSWLIGVRSVRFITAISEKRYSDINWSDINGINTPDPFIARYFQAPEMPTNLRLQ